MVVPLGLEALKTLNLIEQHGLVKLSDAVAKPYERNGRILFPLFHPSSIGRSNRNEHLQRADHRKLNVMLTK